MAVSHHVRSALLLFVLLAALSGCAGGGAGPAPASTSQPAASATLVLWHGLAGAQRQALARLVSRYNQQHPASRVFAQSVPLASLSGDMRAASAAGSAPHMVLLPSNMVGALADDVLLPLDALVGEDAQRGLVPAALGAARATGRDGKLHLYGQPVAFDTLALLYNRANVLAVPATTADMLDLAHGLSDPSAAPPRWGLALNLSVEATIGYLYAFDGRLFDDAGGVALASSGRAGAERWLAWVAGLNADQRAMARPYSNIEIDRAIKNGQVMMTFGWAHQLADYRQLWGDQLGVAALPALSETGRAPVPYVQSTVLGISARASAADQRAAAEFLAYMASDEAQRELLGAGMQPASSALKLDGDDALLAAARVFRQQAEAGQPLPNTPSQDALRDEVWQMQRQVLEGRMPPADAVSAADARLRQVLGQ
ncbi:extracellular solute-binding protein [Chloroflexia bacterium SDU3-3]|nr:extracellular solute-binding protein [Chloroflexia bacterium SDU3-3]